MSSNWTAESVIALAPDPASAKSGQSLAAARQWQTLGSRENAIWGEIKGSGTTPYQTRVDLREPAFKCSCPSRKFPCKHGLGLMLIYAREPAAFDAADMPSWVSDWLSGREERAAKKVERVVAPQAADPEAQKKRADQRETRIAGGLEQLHVWLQDVLRAGFASAQAQAPAFWDAMSARLVDAQAPGLARLVGNLQEALHSGPGCEARGLHAIASLELVRRAYQVRDKLPGDLVSEVRGAVGWTLREEEVIAGAEPVRDRWFVLGSRLVTEERLRVRRTWLHGTQSRRYALLLDFAAGTQALSPGVPPGREVEAGLAFYPGTLGLRAVLCAPPAVKHVDHALPGLDVESALDAYADALGKAPWLERWPMSLGQVRVIPVGEPQSARWHLVDHANRRVDIAPRFAHGWSLLALAGAGPIDVFGEWDGDTLWPLSASRGRQFYTVGEAVIASRETA